MLKFKNYKISRNFLLFVTLYFSSNVLADSFLDNNYNNHGIVGLINMPTARTFDESVHGITIYDGNPDQKITLSSNPFNWLEASFFYTNVQGFPYPGFEFQDYKDKGFNFKIRIKKEGRFPAVAVGFNDFAGTGLYSSEYIVSSYGIKNFDFHYGLGWGRLNQKNNGFKNPFIYLSDKFESRSASFSDFGGKVESSNFFSGESVSPFYGLSYKINDKIFLNLERDSTSKENSSPLIYKEEKSKFSAGLQFHYNKKLSIAAAYERGNHVSIKFVYKNNPKTSIKKYEYKTAEVEENDNKYTRLIKNLEENSIGVNRITESANSIGLELTQFIHPDIKLVEDIIYTATAEAGINKNIKKDIKIADLTAVSEIDEYFISQSKIIYERKKTNNFNQNTSIKFRPFFASREEFFKGALMLENDSELVINDNFLFNTNLKYSLWNNFDDFRFEPYTQYPAQVRSDIKEYLKNVNDGLLIGRAQFDYHKTVKPNHHLMFTGGILEDMFSGIGVEYLYFKPNKNYSFGVEVFNVKKRDYKWGFGHLDYENLIFNGNFYYRNYGLIPFDLKISAGEYLAGDIGTTFEISRTFNNGVNFGVFATFTDVTSEQYGEGSFDKGLFFNIPIYGNFINYSWRPLTKDPGAKLNRRHTLHDLLVKFQPLN